jgi:kynurenine formamidase
VTVLAAQLLACPPPPAQEAAPAPSLEALATARVLDLSYGYDASTLYWPTSPSAFELEVLAHGETPAGYFYSANAFATPEHGGTHLDAPIHFSAQGLAVDTLPLDRLLGPAVVLDVTEQAAADADYRLTAEDVLAWEQAHGTIEPRSVVLLRTGWGRRWPDRRAYFGDDTPGDASNLHFPSYGEAAARLLVEERQASVLGVDTASIDYGPSQDFAVHRVAAASQVAGLENVAQLEALPARGAWILALPMKIVGGSGAPVRIAALLPTEEGDE